MRLIDIKQKINLADENFQYTTRNTGSIYYIEGIRKLKKSIKALVDTNFIEEDNDFVQEVLHTNSNFLSSDNNKFQERIKFLEKVKIILNVMYPWINEYVPTEETETVVNIKLPNVKDLADLELATTLLRKSLAQIVPEVGGQIEIKQLDHGSYWVIIDVGVVEAVSLVLALTAAAFRYTKKYIDLKIQYENYKKAKMENAFLKQLYDANEVMLKMDLNTETNKIDKEHFQKEKKEDNERLERIKNSIKELSKFFKKGGEIHPTLLASENLKKEIPDYKILADTKFTELIENKSDDVSSDENE